MSACSFLRHTARRIRSASLLLTAALTLSCAAAYGASLSPAAFDETRPLRFTVDIDAPPDYRKMLSERLDLARWQGSEPVSLALLRRLAADAEKDTAEALATYGYFAPRITSTVDVVSDDEAVVRMNVDPGPRTRVRALDIGFAGAAVNDPEGRARIEAVRRNWGLAPGGPFTQAEWESAKAAALERLARGRYAAARVAQSEAYIEPRDAAADLTLKLDSGPIFHAGAVHVSGLDRYPPDIVKNFNPHAPGEPYDAIKLDLFQRRLLETGYFNAVTLRIDPDVDQAASAPLQVSVIEARSQRIDTGVSLSTDVGPGFSVDYGNVDVFDSAHRFRTTLDINRKRQRVAASVDTPPRPGGRWNTWSSLLERSDVEGLLSSEAVAGYALNWGLLRVPSQVSLAAHYEDQSVEGSVSRNNYALFGQYRATFRTTDELVSPRRGLIGTAEIGASVPGVSSRTFARARVHVNWLIPAGLRNDILVRGELGAVLAGARERIPSSFLFRTGGDQTVRGYDYQSIGVPEGNAIVGGRYLATASVEYTRWLTDSLGAAAFVDMGDAFDRTGDFDPAMGAGLGVRYRSPVGPIRADVAYGARDSRVRLHFSVGYQF